MRGVVTLRRRHLQTCPHAAKGWNYTLCPCPIWAQGMLDGRRIRQSLGTNDWGRAERRLDILLRGEELHPHVTHVTVAAAVRDFLADCTGRKLEASTIGSYRKTLAHLQGWCDLARIPHLAAISAADLRRYRVERTVAASTLRKEFEHIRAFFRWCVDAHHLPENPAAKLKAPREEAGGAQPFTEAETQALLLACDRFTSRDTAEVPWLRDRTRALVLALLYTGYRISDIAKLRRDQIHEGHIRIRAQKNAAELRFRLHPDAVAALAKLPANPHPQYFFWSGRGAIGTAIRSLRRTIYRLGKLAGVHAHPHRFRDTFACRLLEAGVEIRTVSKLLGHGSVRTTERHYTPWIAAHQRLLDSALETLCFGIEPARPLVVKPGQNRLGNPKRSAGGAL